MNSESSASRHRYDITMSRRTRKQGLQEKPRSEKDNDNSNNVVSLQNLLGVKEDDDGDGINEHKSLKQLIKGDHHHHEKSNNSHNNGRNSLGQHFNEEEKNLQVVRRNESVQEGLKLKKLVRRYAKVLGHLMKAKRDPHLPESSKNPVFKLSK